MITHMSVCCVYYRLLFSQSLLSLDLIELFLAQKTEEAKKDQGVSEPLFSVNQHPSVLSCCVITCRIIGYKKHVLYQYTQTTLSCLIRN